LDCVNILGRESVNNSTNFSESVNHSTNFSENSSSLNLNHSTNLSESNSLSVSSAAIRDSVKFEPERYHFLIGVVYADPEESRLFVSSKVQCMWIPIPTLPYPTLI
jgi:hypothetical protein